MDDPSRLILAPVPDPGGRARIAWTHIWHRAPAASYTVIGGAAFLAAAMQAPLAGTVLVLDDALPAALAEQPASERGRQW
jgi:hypothetical protein